MPHRKHRMEPARHRCRLCGHEWRPRVAWTPKACPACKRYHWHAARKVRAESIKN